MSEYLMLAHNYSGQDIIGWLASEKLDGQRFFWDGGVSRGLLKKDVPYANNLKDSRYKVVPVATGLWTRYGNVIHAPDWWLDQLPVGCCLDGEGYVPYDRQKLRTIVARLEPGPEWAGVTYNVFDVPSWRAFGRSRWCRADSKNKFLVPNCADWALSRGAVERCDVFGNIGIIENDVVKAVPQTRIVSMEQLDQLLNSVKSSGGEGLIVRDGSSYWETERSWRMLKIKPFDDSEGEIVGYTPGEGKYVGMLGAYVIRWGEVVFRLSGMTDLERGCPLPIGTIITFKYRGLTNDGVPQEARIWRKYENV